MSLTIDQIRTLQIEITSYCNAKCPHCPRFDNDGFLSDSLLLQHWDMEKIIKNLEIDKLTSLERIVIEGDKGDPVMHPKLYDLVLHLSQSPSQAIIELTTNGSIQKPDWWARLAKIPNVVVRFSIDGLADTNHLYRVGVNFDRIVDNVLAFTSAGGDAIMKTLLFAHNEHQIEDIKKFSEQMGFFALSFVKGAEDRFLGSPEWPVKVNGKTLHTIRPSSLVAEQVRNMVTYYRPMPRYQQILNHAYNHNCICPALNRGRLYITYQHHVIPCCMMHNDLYYDFPSGRRLVKELVEDVDTIDLSKNTLSEVLSSNFFDNNLENHFYNGPHLPACVKSCREPIKTAMKIRKNT